MSCPRPRTRQRVSLLHGGPFYALERWENGDFSNAVKGVGFYMAGIFPHNALWHWYLIFNNHIKYFV